MKLYFKNFEIYHNISIYLFYFPGAAAKPLGSAEHRLGTSEVADYLVSLRSLIYILFTVWIELVRKNIFFKIRRLLYKLNIRIRF